MAWAATPALWFQGHTGAGVASGFHVSVVPLGHRGKTPVSWSLGLDGCRRVVLTFLSTGERGPLTDFFCVRAPPCSIRAGYSTFL